MRNIEERLLGTKKVEHTEVINAPLSFVIPTEYVDLPSQGKFYPVGHPLRDRTSIEIKQMTAKEEDILASESYIKQGVTLDKLLESIVIDKNIHPGSILSCDRSAIFLAARISAYGPEYKVAINCGACGKQSNINYDLSTGPKHIHVKEDVELTEKGTFVVKLPSTGWRVECKLLNGQDESNTFNDKADQNVILKQLNSIIYSIEGIEDKEQLKSTIESIPLKDSRFLRNIYKDLIPKLKFSLNLDCKCGNKQELEVPVTLEFFWPQ